MLRRSWTICSMAALLLAAPVVAQQPGTLVVGGFGQYTMFDDNLSLKDAFGYGGRVGAFIAPGIWLEAEGSSTQGDWRNGTRTDDYKYGPISARLMFGFPFSSMAGFNAGFHVGGGAVLSSYRYIRETAPVVNGYSYNYGVEGAAGFNATFGGFTALRLQALVDYMPTSEPDATMNFRFQAGLDFWPSIGNLFGGTAMSPATLGPVVWWDDTPQPLPGTLELGGFVQYSFMDDNAGFNANNRPDDGIGYGGRAGVFLTPNWEIEGDGQWSPLDNASLDRTPRPPTTGRFRAFETIDYSTFALRLNYNFPFAGFLGSNSSFLIGGGVVRTNYGAGDDTPDRPATYNYGASGIAGVRIGFAPRVALRIDGVVDYMPNSEPEATLNYAVRGGLSLFLGGAQPAGPPPPVCTWNSSILASDPNCRAPEARCQWNSNITASDPNCRAPVAQPRCQWNNNI
ncbi:MAG TPA: hypothetical protein VMY38_08425, partial [Gemmatimonadaceae bacterium]|nr:hypothetical protein [Gemmatimonadaceae bacterium]